MPWLQITVRIDRDRAAAAESLLGELGAVSVTLTDAGDEPVFQLDRDSTPLWQETIATGLFPDGTDGSGVRQSLRDRLSPLPDDALHEEPLEDQDWERTWMQDYHPVRFGKRLWVCPTWSTPPDPEAVNLMLDPGLAFGSGTHPTTALCLEWLEQQDLHGCRVIDYGCGSGILAIAALKLGAASALGVDNDPQAVTATAANRDNNGVPAERLHVALPGEHDKTPADTLIANILSGPLLELEPVLAGLVRPGGRLVLSGILSEQTAAIRDGYAVHFRMDAPRRREDWICISGERRPD